MQLQYQGGLFRKGAVSVRARPQGYEFGLDS